MPWPIFFSRWRSNLSGSGKNRCADGCSIILVSPSATGLNAEGDVPHGIPLTLREQQERAVLAALDEQKGARILH
jgi:hypothetical protein